MLIISLATAGTVLTLNIYQMGEKGKPVPEIIQLIFFKIIARALFISISVNDKARKINHKLILRKLTETNNKLAEEKLNRLNELKNVSQLNTLGLDLDTYLIDDDILNDTNDLVEHPSDKSTMSGKMKDGKSNLTARIYDTSTIIGSFRKVVHLIRTKKTRRTRSFVQKHKRNFFNQREEDIYNLNEIDLIELEKIKNNNEKSGDQTSLTRHDSSDVEVGNSKIFDITAQLNKNKRLMGTVSRLAEQRRRKSSVKMIKSLRPPLTPAEASRYEQHSPNYSDDEHHKSMLNKLNSGGHLLLKTSNKSNNKSANDSVDDKIYLKPSSSSYLTKTPNESSSATIAL